ncbi:MAG: uracil-DNA glycosylase [Fimbriimonas sp.]|nr:uracil-DNA glycosylase [Fimbriimonas sp.]
MTLDELKATALTCQGCSLSERRMNVVFGEGNPVSPLVLIGEGPGETEDKMGRPFVGRAGQLLDKAIVDAGLQRSQLYITNTVKCRAADWSTGKPVNRPPADDEVLACRKWLEPQIAILKPKVILCIGGPSAKNLIKKNFQITKERGMYFPCEFARTAIATLHPSYILRQMNISGDGGYSLLVADIQRAWEAAQKLATKEGSGKDSGEAG